MEKMTKKEKKEARKQEWQEKLKKQDQNKKLKKFGIWAGVLAVLILSVYGLFKLVNSPQTEDTASGKVPPVTKEDIAVGSPSAKVTLVEYSDFQCPACAAYHPLVKQLISEFEGKMLFAYRFFPIQSHQNAMISAQAAYAAGLANKFWEMHDMLFQTQNNWANSGNASETFTDYAKKLKLDINKFKKDLESGETKNFINNQYSQGLAIGVNSTPTFFINGTKIQNPRTYDDFKKLIQDEINKK